MYESALAHDEVTVRQRYGAPGGWAALDELVSQGWHLVATLTEEGREPRYEPWDRVPVGGWAMRFLRRNFPSGVYLHQAEALRRLRSKANVCLTTATASGKSAVFYAQGLEILEADHAARVLAIYPTKALVAEQQERWERAIAQGAAGEIGHNGVVHAGRPPRVGRLDGSVKGRQRLNELRSSSVLVATPDVIHSWLLSHVGEPAVFSFLRNLRLVVVDEVHQYTGVFGSNAAFLFRRLRHLLHVIGNGEPQFIAASATVASPEKHLYGLFGVPFELIGPELDSSELHPKAIHLVQPPSGADIMGAMAQLVHTLTRQQRGRFIAFVDSRKQAELIAAIVKRGRNPETLAGTEGAGEVDTGPNVETHPEAALVNDYEVLPYRAGLEEEDRQAIQRRLSEGTLRGVVSTSALELGVNIPHLDIGVLVGVPQSATSLRQRIGRVGRASPGTVFVVNTGSLLDQTIFDDPPSLLRRPPVESAFYLSNRRVQYIHALCLARERGEHDQALAAIGHAPDSTSFSSPIQWPEGFLELCARERTGEIDSDLRSMKENAGDEPQLVFPLRDVEQQFSVECRGGHGPSSLGTLTHSQLMREAYPGAVYYYMGTPYRVIRVNLRSKTVLTRHERYYTTQPTFLPPQIFPYLSEDEILSAWRLGDLRVVETQAQVREALSGFKERRGSQQYTVTYPLRAGSDDGGTGLADSVYFGLDRFSRHYFTTAVLLLHPGFDESDVELGKLGDLILEAFLFVVPFERQDINVGVDRVRRGTVAPWDADGADTGARWSAGNGEGLAIPTGARFVALYDQTYGSLRLSGRLAEPAVLREVLSTAAQMAAKLQGATLSKRTVEVAEALARAAAEEPLHVGAGHAGAGVGPGRPIGGGDVAGSDGRLIRVIRPGSRGVSLRRDNEEFIVEKVLPFHPRHQGPVYKGRFVSEGRHDNTATFVAVSDVVPIPGESVVGLYDPESDEFVEEA